MEKIQDKEVKQSDAGAKVGVLVVIALVVATGFAYMTKTDYAVEAADSLRDSQILSAKMDILSSREGLSPRNLALYYELDDRQKTR